MRIMARYPAKRKTETRARILAAAERLINERGTQGASVEAVMREAGLTVGGFYAHFPSKESLVDEAMLAGLDRSLTRLVEGLDDAPPPRFALALIDGYLAQARQASLADACPLTLLLADVARADDASRQRFAARTGSLVERIESRLPPVPDMAPRDVALALFAALAGAVSFARTAATPRGRERILAATRASLVRWLALPSDDAGGA
jgi:TetR/AcrR family transcriptional repressor of nem operon